MSLEWIALLLFASIFLCILTGFPVAFVLGGLSVIFGYFLIPDFFDLLPMRIMGTMQNVVLLAVPLFIFMGLMLEKSGLAESMLTVMSRLFGKVRGGLAIAVILVGALLAASTGIVGATVVTMGLISLPVMLKNNYSIPLATGTIASAGTLGQIIPPSIVLILLGSVLNVSVGDLFKAAVIPSVLLVISYMGYVLITAKLYPDSAPLPDKDMQKQISTLIVIKAFVLPLLLILAVLGSIFWGIATPTEAAAVGALGAILLTLLQGKLNSKTIQEVSQNTTHLTSMVFLILLGATTFALVFRGLGGDRFLVELITTSQLSATTFLILVMIAVFVLGFFIDFIEIVFIVVPVVAPIFAAYDYNLVWIGILLALNLQSSFLTPPFGFALFYLKGVSPPEVHTSHLYRGIIPFLVIQLVVLALVIIWPNIIL